MRSSTFDDRAAIYDLLIDWPKRLANETPLFRSLLEQVGATRVLDASCGTGQHAALFHSWGLAVEGADVIFHHAAAVGSGISMVDVRRFVEVNSLGTANLLELCIENRERIRKVIVAKGRLVNILG